MSKKPITIIYDQKMGCITYQMKDRTISAMLIAYDDAVSIVDFRDGLLTILMRKGGMEEEEYVDFGHALSSLYLSKQSHDYFDNVSKEDLLLVKR